MLLFSMFFLEELDWGSEEAPKPDTLWCLKHHIIGIEVHNLSYDGP